MSSSERRSLTRRTFALLVVLGLALPAIVSSKEVALRVDGARTSFRTYAATVGDVLANRGVELAAGDMVVPPPYTPLEDGTRIRILRTIEVGLVIDDEPQRQVRGTFRSVSGLLETVGITDVADLEIRPGLRDAIDDGDVVHVRTPRRVTVRVDDQTFVRDTLLTRLDLLLVELGIEVDEADLTDPPLDTVLTDGLEVTIQRVETEEHVEEVVLPFDTETVETDELYEGQSRVAQRGVEGLRIDTYRLTFVDGVEADRTLVSQEVTREPVTRIVEQGTRKRPVTDPDNPDIWYKLAWCESRQDWDYNGASGYDGGLQFHPTTWRAWRYAGYPDYAWQATPEQQIAVGQRLQAARGWNPWPSCARKLGLLD